jgi:hypothetical protein
MSAARIRKIAETANALEADAILLLGDFICAPTKMFVSRRKSLSFYKKVCP